MTDRTSTETTPSVEIIAITGASRGIGADVARYLARRNPNGLRLVITARDKQALGALKSELELSGAEVKVVVADLSDPGSMPHVAQELWAAFDGLDGLVNNAGISITGPATSMSPADWSAVIDMNLSSPALLAAAIGDRMAKRGRGRIINITSVAGSRALADHFAYSSSKAGLIMATKVLATELGSQGVRANSISPTVVLTEMGTRVWGDPEKSAPMLARIPGGTFATPEHVAAAVEYLLSPGAEMLNGHDLVVDGGFSAN